MLVRQLRVDAFPSEFAGRLLDQDPVSHPRLLTRGTPLHCRVVPRPSAVVFLLPPLEYPSQLQKRLLPLRHEIVEPRGEGVPVECRVRASGLVRASRPNRIRNGVPPEGTGVYTTSAYKHWPKLLFDSE